MRRAGTIVSRDQLAEHVWGGDYDPCSNVADVYVGYLRRKLAGTRCRPTRSARSAGSGYMLDARRGLMRRPLSFRARLTLRWTVAFGLLLACANIGGLHGRARVRAARPRRQSAHAGRHRDRVVDRCRRRAAPARAARSRTRRRRLRRQVRAVLRPRRRGRVRVAGAARRARAGRRRAFARRGGGEQRRRPPSASADGAAAWSRHRSGTRARRTSRPSACSPTSSMHCWRGSLGARRRLGAGPGRDGLDRLLAGLARARADRRITDRPPASPPATSTCGSTRRAATTRSGA